MKQLRSKPYLFDLIFLALGIGFAYFLCLGCYNLISPDESRYAEIAREMITSKDFITPHLNYVLYFEKPIFFYWLQSIAGMVFGLSEWAMRFWTATLGILGCLIAYTAGRKFYNRRTGLYAAIILASSLLYFGMSHLITLDMTVSVLIASSLFFFQIGTLEENNLKRRFFIWIAFGISALAVLTKGLIGIVFPMMIVGTWVLLLNKWREIKKWYLPSSILIFLLIALPWHILLQLKQPSFFHFYFIEQQFSRYSTLSANRYEPFYFYINAIFIGLIPWSVFIIQSIKHNWFRWRNRKNNESTLFLFLTIILITLFFSISHSKLIPYILPVFPSLAILIGKYFADFQDNKTIGLRIGFVILPIIAILLTAFIINAPRYYPLANPEFAYIHLRLFTTLISITMISALCFYFYKNLKTAFTILTIGTLLSLIILLPAISHIDHRSIKPLAVKINQLKKSNDKIVSLYHYYQDLPFYTRGKVDVVACASELDFGTQHQDTSKWIYMDINKLWQQWNKPKRIFAVTRLTDLQDIHQKFPQLKIFELAKTQRNVLISNQQ